VTVVYWKVYIMVEENGLRLVIELSPEEAKEFRKLAKTDNPSYLDGIAKSLVLGAGNVVNPQDVFEDITLLGDISEYGLRGDLAAKQEWADALSFTREQLQLPSVMDAICAWAIFFGSDLKELTQMRRTPHIHQAWWFKTNARSSTLLEILRDTIRTTSRAV